VKDDTFYDDEHPDQQGLNGGHDNEDTESNNHPILQYPSNQEVSNHRVYTWHLNVSILIFNPYI
jgi:hypothetical protein